MHRLLFITLMGFLVLSGCSSTKLAYRYADWGIVWWVDDYVSMTSEQQTRLEQDIQNLRRWHCSTELPRYSDWLTTLKDDVRNRNLNSETVAFHQEQLFSFFPPLIDQAKPAAVSLLSSLSDEQVRELADTMAESQTELEEEFLADDPKQTRQARAERTAERVERWLGPLSEKQQQIVQQWSDARGNQTRIWLEGRKNWQQALLDALEQRSEPGFAKDVDYLIDNNAEVRGAEYQEMMDESRASISALMTDLLQGSDQRQLDHLLDRASDLRGDFNTLACTGEDAVRQSS